MEIEKVLEGSKLIITLKGRLDTNTAPDLEKEVACLNEIKDIVLDLKNLDYISSAGLRIILGLQKIMNIQGSMIIKNPKESIKEVFDMTGFSNILTIE